jgi:DNA-binding MurR/RpiR family transcriptional regulator
LTTTSDTLSAAPVGVVELLETRFLEFSPTLRKAARFAIDHPEEVAINSMRAVAKRAGVHPNTMLRMAREVGFDSYDIFRDGFRKIVMQGRQAGWLNRAQTIRDHFPEGPNGQLIGAYAHQEISNLQEVFNGDSLPNLNKAVSFIRAARVTYILGLRSLFPVAYYFHYVCRLFSNRFVLLMGVGGTFADELRSVRDKDVLLAFSYHPYARDTVKAVEFARSKGAQIVSVTDSRVSPIVGDGAISLIVNTTSKSLFPTVLPAFAIAQVLATLLVSAGDNETLLEISRSQEQLDNFGVYVE